MCHDKYSRGAMNAKRIKAGDGATKANAPQTGFSKLPPELQTTYFGYEFENYDAVVDLLTNTHLSNDEFLERLDSLSPIDNLKVQNLLPRAVRLRVHNRHPEREALETFAAGLGQESFDAIVDRLKHTPYANRRLKGVPIYGVDLDTFLASIVDKRLEPIRNNDLEIAKVVLDVLDAVFCPDVQANALVPEEAEMSEDGSSFVYRTATNPDGYYVAIDIDDKVVIDNDVINAIDMACMLFKANVLSKGFRINASVIITLPSDTAVELKGNLHENVAMTKERIVNGEATVNTGSFKSTKTLLVQLLKMSNLFHSSAGQLYVSSGFADMCSV
jgi:hypothetical protein